MDNLITTNFIDDSQNLVDAGKKFAQTLNIGDLVILTGPLGAGKTTFTKGVAIGLNIKSTVTSPTFTLAKEYQGYLKSHQTKISLTHVDVYRIEDIAELDILELPERLNDGVVIMEWGERFMDELTDYCTHQIFITPQANSDLRKLAIKKYKPQ